MAKHGKTPSLLGEAASQSWLCGNRCMDSLQCCQALLSILFHDPHGALLISSNCLIVILKIDVGMDQVTFLKYHILADGHPELPAIFGVNRVLLQAHRAIPIKQHETARSIISLSFRTSLCDGE